MSNIDLVNLAESRFLKALDALYERGANDQHDARKFDARGCREYQAVLDMVRAPQWLPIDSAPKDGTEFQAFKQGIGQFTALILTSEHMDCQYEGGVHCAWDHEYVEDVSHWQPLPAPPEVKP